jgi:APA family basic amino acid/polyamine antiporter
MIGTGIFIKPAIMAQHAGSAAIVLLAWLVAGLLSYAGALTYGELCARLPAAGGEYAILRESYGSFTAYMYGWMRFTIGAPGSAASYAVGAAAFLQVVFPYHGLGLKTWHVAAAFLAFFTLINCLTLFVSATVQVTLTIIKVASLVAIGFALFWFAPASTAVAPTTHWPGMLSFSAALMAALWAYDGWNNLPMLGGEVSNARRNLPLALALGMGIVLATYMLVNAGYFRVLSFSAVVASNPSVREGVQPVAALAMHTVISDASVRVVAALMVVSALGALNGSLLSSARVPYAMATDGVFFPPLARLSRNHAIPVLSTLSQGAIAILLAMSGTFDQLTDSVVFASWIFYALTAGAVFRLRRRAQQSETIFHVPLYPVLPALFIVCSAAFIAYAIFAMPYLTGLGLLVITLGAPIYAVFRRRR